MAVVRKQTSIEDTITLDDGQVLAVKLCRGGFNVGDQEQIVETASELPFLQKRIEKLGAQVEGAETDEEYQSRMEEFRLCVKRLGALSQVVDMSLHMIVEKWDLYLTEDDEAAGKTVPLTIEAISQLPDALRSDIFAKVTEKLRSRTEQEKKALSAISQNGSQTQTPAKVGSQPFTPDTSLPSDTASGPRPSSDGLSTSSTKPS